MRSFVFVLGASILASGCATVQPPNPPLPITSHAVSAADYPAESVRAHEMGTAQVQYLVLADGTVRDTILARSSGSPRLDQAAVDIVTRWQFKPASQSGRSVPAWLNANVVFQLN